MTTLFDFTVCENLNDVGGCMIQADCNRTTDQRAKVNCFVPLVIRKKSKVIKK